MTVAASSKKGWFTPENNRRYFEARLSGFTANGHPNLSLHCPFHEDSTPSFALNVDEGVWMCHTGCGQGGVLDFEQLYSSCDRETARQNVAELLGETYQPHDADTGGQPEAIYEYWDAHHRNLLFRKLRKAGKVFVIQRPDGEGWRDGLGNVKERPLYGLPGLVTADTAFITEGEKDCDRLRSLKLKKLRFAYVTNFDGAGHWRPEYNKYFAGKDVVIFADNDEARAQTCPGRGPRRQAFRR